MRPRDLLCQFLEKEIELCEARRGSSGRSKDFEDGFIAGIKQSILFAEKAPIEEEPDIAKREATQYCTAYVRAKAERDSWKNKSDKLKYELSQEKVMTAAWKLRAVEECPKEEREVIAKEIEEYRRLHETTSECNCKDEVVDALAVATHRVRHPDAYRAKGSMTYVTNEVKSVETTK